jgi:methyl acetate hydrolase
VVALAADRQGLVYEGAFGTSGPSATAPMRLDSVFRIASMTKAVTGAAAMKLIEEGKLSLEQPMAQVAPELGEVMILSGWDADGKPQLRRPRGAITLRHLLTHTSGFSYDLFNKDVSRYMQEESLPSIATCKYDSLRAPLVFEPGERWEYGIGIDWVGQIVERVSGQQLEPYLQEHFFGPLGMRDTSFLVREGFKSRLVEACVRTPAGLAPLAFDFPTDADFHMGGGGLYSTGPDYLRFTRMLLGGGSLGGTQVLASETVRLMGEIAIGDVEVFGLKSDNHAVALPTEIYPNQIKRWGLSFVLNTKDIPGGRAAWSLAWSGAHNTYFWVDSTRGLTAVLMMQLLPYNDPTVVEILESYEQALYAGRP